MARYIVHGSMQGPLHFTEAETPEQAWSKLVCAATAKLVLLHPMNEYSFRAVNEPPTNEDR